ncbi:MAG TPA: SUMF1/EgtB/PvdO family nonheme iron enzyme, partial [Gemmatimonadales bacterium]
LGEHSLYVPGAPGAGKSTFCRWLALAVANRGIPPHPVATPDGFEEVFPDALHDRLPLLCRLRELAGHPACLAGNGTWTRKQLEDGLACWIAATRPGGLTPEVFREELDNGRCLVILDGVDEVPERVDGHLPRRNLLTGLADALPDWLKAGNRVLLTSRPYGLGEEDRRRLALPVAELAELPGALQATFVRRWYAAADPPHAEDKATGLIAHLDDRPDLVELRANPMLLTALCVKYDEGRRLPQDFYRLYDSVVSQVLYKRYATEIERDRARLRLAAVALGMHRGDAQHPRLTPEAEVTTGEVDRHLAALTRTDPTTETGAVDAATRREDLLSNSGLLLPRGEGRCGFYHLSFQEFLAALRLRAIDEDPHHSLTRHATTRAWHRTLTFLFCALADQGSPEAAVKGYEPLLARLEPERLEADAVPALLLADCLEIAHGRGWNLARFAAPLRQACHHALDYVPPPERAHLWRTLGEIGLDDRPGVGVKDGLPDIDWVEVPCGTFLYGEKRAKISLGPFHIARYPVTHAQFQSFVDDHGYDTDAWWEGLAGRPAPARPGWSYPNHPRETVSWYEAVAFGRWLTARLRACGDLADGEEIRLPTEQEWERAARGTDGREYPWGEFQSGHANIDETSGKAGPHYLQQTSAVGIYPLGASPCGALDMAGNVWEWCLNQYDPPENIAVGGDDSRVVRGGSWFFHRDYARCAFRYFPHPGLRLSYFGFRLVRVSPIP